MSSLTMPGIGPRGSRKSWRPLCKPGSPAASPARLRHPHVPAHQLWSKAQPHAGFNHHLFAYILPVGVSSPLQSLSSQHTTSVHPSKSATNPSAPQLSRGAAMALGFYSPLPQDPTGSILAKQLLQARITLLPGPARNHWSVTQVSRTSTDTKRQSQMGI